MKIVAYAFALSSYLLGWGASVGAWAQEPFPVKPAPPVQETPIKAELIGSGLGGRVKISGGQIRYSSSDSDSEPAYTLYKPFRQLLKQGIAAYEAKRWKEAERALGGAIQILPDTDAIRCYARSLQMQSEYAAALNYLQGNLWAE